MSVLKMVTIIALLLAVSSVSFADPAKIITVCDNTGCHTVVIFT